MIDKFKTKTPAIAGFFDNLTFCVTILSRLTAYCVKNGLIYNVSRPTRYKLAFMTEAQRLKFIHIN
jgi:hypothetical protein